MTAQIPHPYRLTDAKQWLAGVAERRKAGTHLTYAICTKPHLDLVGIVSLMGVKDQQAELAYWLGKASWGKGLCTEAGQTLLGAGFTDLDLQGVHGKHIAGNTASKRVLEKLGFTFRGTRRGKHRGKEMTFCTYFLKRSYLLVGV